MILVTGGTGLLGAHLIMELLQNPENEIRAITRSRKSADKLKTIALFYPQISLKMLNKVQWVEADVTDLVSLENVFDGIEQVYHCAAAVSFNPRLRSRIMQTNISGTANIVNLSIEHGVKKFCHVSSIAAIGGDDKTDIRSESDEWDAGAQRSFYSQSKYLSEMEVWRGMAEGLNATIVNPSVILGPGIWGESSTAIFKQVWNGLRYYTPGGTGFVDVRDVVRIMTQLMDQEKWGERFIVNAENVNYQTLLAYIAQSLNKSVPSKLLHTLVASAAWRIDATISLLTRKNPSFSRENKRTCFNTSKYSNNKIVDNLNYSFIPLKKSIDEAGRFFVQILAN